MPTYYRRKEDFEIVHPDEMRVHIEAAQSFEMKALLSLAWLTGSRIQELVNLKHEDVKIDREAQDGMVIIHALKFGKTAYPSFAFTDPFVTEYVVPYLEKIGRGVRPFPFTKRHYQKKLERINRTLYPDDKRKWITFHYLRHSRLSHMGQVLRAYPEEFKSWTGHRSSAFEDYYAPRRVDRFKGKLGEER